MTFGLYDLTTWLWNQLLYQLPCASRELIARHDLRHTQRLGPMKRINFFMIGEGENGNVFEPRVGFECLQSVKGIQTLVVHVQNDCGWVRGRSPFGNILLSACPFDLVPFRYHGIADFGIEKYVGYSDEDGFWVCPVCLVFLVYLVRSRGHSNTSMYR